MFMNSKNLGKRLHTHYTTENCDVMVFLVHVISSVVIVIIIDLIIQLKEIKAKEFKCHIGVNCPLNSTASNQV